MKLLSNKLLLVVGILALTGGVVFAAPVINQTLGTWSDTFSDDVGVLERDGLVVEGGSVALGPFVIDGLQADEQTYDNTSKDCIEEDDEEICGLRIGVPPVEPE